MPTTAVAKKTGKANSVLIIEDHPLYRDALVSLLDALLGASRVIAVSTAEEGLYCASNISDLRLVMLNDDLPGLSGTEAIVAMRRACPMATLMVISASNNQCDATAAFHAGAQLFVSKTVSTRALVDTLSTVASGNTSVPHARMPSIDKSAVPQRALPTLTPRQRQILLLLLDGYSNKKISLHLNLAEVTVKMHLSAVFRALGVSNRTQAVIAARRLGLPKPLAEAI